MFVKIAVLACVIAVARAGLASTYGAPTAIASYAAPQVASYAAPAIASYAAPAYSTYSAPAYSSYAAPAITATSDNVYRSAGNLHSISTQTKSIATPYSSSNRHFTSVTNPGVYAQAAYAAPVAHATYAAAPVAHATYAAAPVAHATYASAAPLAYASHAAPAVAHGSSLLGVAYSPAAAVSHLSYSSPVGINYSW